MAEIQGHLTLIGDDFDTALVLKLLGRLPTYVREKTEVLGNGQLFGHCEWGVETALMEAEDFQPVSDSLWEMLDCSAELLKKAAHDCNAEWSILYYVEVYDDFPVIYFSQNFIQFSAEIGAHIGADVYLLNRPDVDEMSM